MRSDVRFLFVFLLLSGVVFTAQGAEDRNLVHAQLFLAQNSDIRDDLPKDDPLRKSLDHLIGYDFYQVMGDAWARIDSGEPQWLLPCKTFYCEIHPEKVGSSSYWVSLWQDKQLIFSCVLKPHRTVPLIVTGPKHGAGQLVLVLTWP